MSLCPSDLDVSGEMWKRYSSHDCVFDRLSGSNSMQDGTACAGSLVLEGEWQESNITTQQAHDTLDSIQRDGNCSESITAQRTYDTLDCVQAHDTLESIQGDGNCQESIAAQRTYDTFDCVQGDWVSAGSFISDGDRQERGNATDDPFDRNHERSRTSAVIPPGDGTDVQASSSTGNPFSPPGTWFATCEICSKPMAHDESAVLILPKGKRVFRRTKLNMRGAKKCHKKCFYSENANPEPCKPCTDWHKKGKCRKEFGCRFSHH